MKSNAWIICLVFFIVIVEKCLVNSKPKITQIFTWSEVYERIAHTRVTGKIKNNEGVTQEIPLTIIITKTAVFKDFFFEVNGVNYTTVIKDKEAAEDEYIQAVNMGSSGVHISMNGTDFYYFKLEINIEPYTDITFHLLFDQILNRREGNYEHVFKVDVKEPVQEYSANVVIFGKHIVKNLDMGVYFITDEAYVKVRNNSEDFFFGTVFTTTLIRYNFNYHKQKNYVRAITNEPISCVFDLRFLDEGSTQTQIIDQGAYHLSFFDLNEVAHTIPKYFIFVIDTSLYMKNKIPKLKTAMYQLLEQLEEYDTFSLLEYNTNVKVWNMNGGWTWYPSQDHHYDSYDKRSEINFDWYAFPKAYLANSTNIDQAKRIISQLEVKTDLTDIYSALRTSLYLAELEVKQKSSSLEQQPIIIFLTDGGATVRLQSKEEIIKRVTNYNTDERESPMIFISLGTDADQAFLKRLANNNNGFVKYVYSNPQLQTFKDEIGKHLLNDKNFKRYTSVRRVVKGYFIQYLDSELITVHKGRRVKDSTSIAQNDNTIERLWAYLAVKEYFEDDDGEEAEELALKYNFVTDITSMLATKLNGFNFYIPQSAKGVNPDVAYPGHFPYGP